VEKRRAGVTTEQIAIVSGAAVGIAGVLAPTLTAWLDRKHRRDLAQAERRHALRSRTYADAAAFLERERLLVMRTEAIVGPAPPAPPPLHDDDWTQLEGRITVASSRAVRAAIQEAHRQANLFVGAVMAYRGVRAQPQQLEGAGNQMHEARTAALAAIDDAERVMREELDSL
jgi:hypothetical protein